jgi:hypothetical protein
MGTGATRSRRNARRRGQPGIQELFSSLKEMEELLRFPSVGSHVDRANALAMGIARSAPSGRIANLAP